LVYLGFPENSVEMVEEMCKNLGLEKEHFENILKITGFKAPEGFEEWKNQIEENQPMRQEEKQELSRSQS
jgi:hypothetical protein